MKNRCWLITAIFAGCLLLGGMILNNFQTTTRATAKAKADHTTVIESPQECAECENKCKAWIDKCKEGGQYACYKAAACLCKCNLSEPLWSFRNHPHPKCYEKNEKAAKELESPGQR